MSIHSNIKTGLFKSGTMHAHLERVFHVGESTEDCSALWRPRDGSCSKRQRAHAARQALLAAVAQVFNQRLVVTVPVLVDCKDAT